jgi:hypothetical protein
LVPWCAFKPVLSVCVIGRYMHPVMLRCASYCSFNLGCFCYWPDLNSTHSSILCFASISTFLYNGFSLLQHVSMNLSLMNRLFNQIFGF